jgi:hypothetical protein
LHPDLVEILQNGRQAIELKHQGQKLQTSRLAESESQGAPPRPQPGDDTAVKIVIAPDSYKESLSAMEVATHIEAGFREVFPEATYV